MGTGTFAEPTFEAILAGPHPVVGLVTQPDRAAGSRSGSTRQVGKGMKAIADAHSVPVMQPDDINTADHACELRAFDADLLVVAAYGQILSKDVLATPTFGAINVHASLLPKYRGAAPVAYAILNGEAQTGVTIIKVTPGLDSGDMILQDAVDILPDDTTGSLEVRLSVLGAKLAVDAVKLYQSGEPVPGKKQDPALVTKAPKIKKEFGLIDWSKPAEEICRHIRAMQPWPTAYTFLHQPGRVLLRLIVSTAKRYRHIGDGSPPGTAVGIKGKEATFLGTHLLVSAGSPHPEVPGSFVDIQELQPAGKKKMTAEEFLRGYPIVEGMRFGPEVLS